ETRIRLLMGAVMGLCGPTQKLAIVMPLTVIVPGDVADRILDTNKYPEWNGERTKLLYQFPENMDLWDKYAEIKAQAYREGDKDAKAATRFYRKHRKEMDKGAVVAWKYRYNDEELSAIQHAMNLYYKDEAAFWAEYQNEPKDEHLAETPMPTRDELVRRHTGLIRGLVPRGVRALTAFIDVHNAAFYWMVVAWLEDATGYVIDYDTYPRQSLEYFTLPRIPKTLQNLYPGMTLQGRVYRALVDLFKELFSTKWPPTGAMIDRCLVDAGWGLVTDVVHRACSETEYGAVVMPSYGRYVTPKQRRIEDWSRKPGDQRGFGWLIRNRTGTGGDRYVLYDANKWKSIMANKLSLPWGEKGALAFFSGKDHRLLADHLTSEYVKRAEGTAGPMDEWKLRPGNPDDHWLDCLAGCCVAASTLDIHGDAFSRQERRKVYTADDLKRRISRVKI
ncbi:MAG: hypothetical protein DRH17_13550, partial [Deltaproteobacteria bacterium]